MNNYEHPSDLLTRLRLGREEYLQRLITTLLVGGTYPRWNSRNRPTSQGADFLRALHALSFPGAQGINPEVFVDELDLPARHPDEKGGAPDWAVLWPDRVWLVELKTEAASHRPGQIPSYFALGAHHFPGGPVDITYWTTPLAKPAPDVPEGSRYSHVTWSDVAPLLARTWHSADDPARPTVEAALRVVDGLAGPARGWRDAFLGRSPQHATPAPDAVEPMAPEARRADDDPVEVARLTADDGRQRAVPIAAASLEDLQAARLALRRSIAAQPVGDPVRRVVPWLWSAETSRGRAMSLEGAEHGFEVRVSRYATEQYAWGPGSQD